MGLTARVAYLVVKALPQQQFSLIHLHFLFEVI